MTRRRWIADEVHGDTAILAGEHAAHLSRVLRGQVGQEFEVATGDAVRKGRITSVSDDRVELSLGGELAWNPITRLTLALAIFKFDRMEWAIEKCAEIGVATMIPIIAQRTDTHLASAAVKRHQRWQRLVRQAAEQSRQAAPPEISSPIKLKELGSFGAPPASPSGATRIVLAETERHSRLRDVLQPPQSDVILAIGPEGGWTEDELKWFHQSGWIAASLGDTILRAETAAIVATALAIDALR
jgi:16S rRNA (uracil1498-N3)-methyltransferase